MNIDKSPYTRTPQGMGKRQQGMGKWAWLLFIGLIALVATSALRLGPHYVDFQMVKGVVDRLQDNKVHGDMSRKEILEHFSKQFRVESFRQPVKDIIKIDRSRDETVLTVAYEIREHLISNVDVVLVFSEQRTYK